VRFHVFLVFEKFDFRDFFARISDEKVGVAIEMRLTNGSKKLATRRVFLYFECNWSARA